jgi:hypothetical protein
LILPWERGWGGWEDEGGDGGRDREGFTFLYLVMQNFVGILFESVDKSLPASSQETAIDSISTISDTLKEYSNVFQDDT